MTKPDSEKALSEDEEELGTQKTSLASLANRGKWCPFIFHHRRTSTCN
jgi:hypothetical protein